MGFSAGLRQPRDLAPLDADRWKEYFKRRGFGRSTTAHRLGALSNDYTYLQCFQVDSRPRQEQHPVQSVAQGNLAQIAGLLLALRLAPDGIVVSDVQLESADRQDSLHPIPRALLTSASPA